MKSAKLIASLIQTAYGCNNNVLIAGDFNCKEIDWENEIAPKEKHHLSHFINVLQDCYLYQHVTEPTRYKEGEIANLLDLILTSEEGAVHDLTYHPPLGESDHVCLRFNVPFKTHSTPKTQATSYNFFKTNFVRIIERLKIQKWDELLTKSFADDYETFIEILTEVMQLNTKLLPNFNCPYGSAFFAGFRHFF